MKTKTIFKTLALAMLMPTMLLTTACSSDDNDIVNTENPANIQKGYALPVTVNVTRQGDDATTRASYDGETRKLSFSTGDKLFVTGDHDKAGQFAGTLDYDAVSGKFSGTVTTKEEYTGTADALFTDANSARAFLMPAGHESYGFFSIEGSGYDAMISFDFTKAFALTKAAAVEQFSVERAFVYSSGFALAPMNAIANFTISGLTANKEVAVSFDTGMTGVIDGNVTTSAEGVATFAVGVLSYDKKLEDCTLTVDGNNIAMPTKTVEAGHIYNISRSVAAAPAATDLSTIASDYTAKDGETLTGTLGSNVKISIADGATVTLNNVTINGTNDSNYEWAGITCLGDATIILSGTNTVKGFYGDYPGIQAAAGKTLIINGTGSLAASSYGWGAGIGAGSGSGLACGNIEIQGGTITATSGEYGAGIGGGNNASWGNITISGGTVTATGGFRGAGIGGGRKSSIGSVSCGNILISGGTITATGGEDAAGIGGGRGYNSGTLSSCGTITITTGVTKVTATKGEYATNSIGAGNLGTCGTVTIEDGANVTQN